MITHTPPTSLLPHPDSRTRRRFSRMAFLVNSSLVFVLAEGGRAGNEMIFFFFYSSLNVLISSHLSQSENKELSPQECARLVAPCPVFLMWL